MREIQEFLERVNSGAWQRRTTHAYQSMPAPDAGDNADDERAIARKTKALDGVRKSGVPREKMRKHAKYANDIDTRAKRWARAIDGDGGNVDEAAEAVGEAVKEAMRDE